MKNVSTQSQVALHVVVSRVSASSIPSATRKNSFIINDVPAGMEASTDEHMLATILGSLLSAVITHTENTCIRISAQHYGRIVLLHLKEAQLVSSPNFAGGIRQVQQLAEKIGGTVSVTNEPGEGTTIVFGFVNNLPVAA